MSTLGRFSIVICVCHLTFVKKKISQILKFRLSVVDKKGKTLYYSKTMSKNPKKSKLYAMFFNSEGPLVQVAILKGQSITGHVFTNFVLKKVKEHYERKRTKSGIRNIRLLHETPQHINPRLYMWDHFWAKKMFLVCPILPIHQTCLSVSIFLFLKMRKHFRKIYGSRNAVGSVISQYINTIEKNYMNAFKAWINRLKLCLSVKGEYFEGNRRKNYLILSFL